MLGSDNDAELLRAVSGRGEDEIVEAIDEALARSLLTEIPPPSPQLAPSYGFPYEVLRRTAYESATLARRRLLHGRAADALTRRYERDPATTRAATVASHLQLAGRDEEAAQWWWRAAEVARELYAHAEAHAHLTKALALGYPQLPGRMALGEALVALGRYREALAEFETAAALAAEGDRATQAAIEHKLADVHHRLGDWDLADAHLAVVTELVEGTEPGRWPGPWQTGPSSPTGAARSARPPTWAGPRWPVPGPPPIPAPRRRRSTCSACWPPGPGIPLPRRAICGTAWPRPGPWNRARPWRR